MDKLSLYTQRYRDFCFIFLFTFPIFSLKIVTISFVVFSVLTLLLFFIERPKFIKKDLFFYLLFILPFLPYLFEYCFFSDNPVIRFELEKKILFFITPVIFYISSLLGKPLSYFSALKTYVISVSIFSVCYFIILFFSGIMFSNNAYLNGSYELRTFFENISGLHPTYYGLFSTTASLFIVFYFHKFSRNIKLILVFFLFFNVLLGFLIASKMPLIILIFGLFYLAYFKSKSKLQFGGIVLVILSCLFFLSNILPSFHSRVLETISFYSNPGINNTLIERNAILFCSKAVFWQDFFTGVGARNSQFLLDYCYLYFGFNKGFVSHFNSHNQFLTLGISYGIGVVFLFVSLFGIVFYKLRHNTAAVIFLFSSFVIMLTESILERQIGIYFFLFLGLLFLQAVKKANNHSVLSNTR